MHYLFALVLIVSGEIGSGDARTTKARKDPLRHTIIYNPNHGYEPYWADGEWHIRNPGEWNLTDSTATTTRPPTVCGDECPYLFTTIKHVCAKQAMNATFDYCEYRDKDYCGENEKMLIPVMATQYKTFNSYCEFLDMQCKNATNYRGQYNLMYIGKCVDDFNSLFKPMSHFKYVQERLDKYLAHLKLTTDLRFSVHQTFPTTKMRV